MRQLLGAAILRLIGCVFTLFGATQSAIAADPPQGLESLNLDARNVMPLVESSLARSYVQAVRDLPAIAPRRVYRDEATKTWLSSAAAGALSDEQRGKLTARDLDEQFYYHTKYGSPLAYARAIDLLAGAGLKDVQGAKIVDFGCGGVAQLRLLASLGADVIGVDVDTMLPAFFDQPGDLGNIVGGAGRSGSVRLAIGSYPADEKIKAEVGVGLDLFLSKNTLKNGYIHPAEKVDPRMLIHLGVDDAMFVQTLALALKPGGLVMIYNICPAPAAPGKPYLPYADGRCPFSKELWEASGFRVVAFDADDSQPVRKLARALRWDETASMDLEADTFAWYSLFQRK